MGSSEGRRLPTSLCQLRSYVVGTSTLVNQGTVEISRKLRWFIQPYEKFLGDREIIFTPASLCGLKALMLFPLLVLRL